MENENLVKVYRLKMIAREIDDTALRIRQIEQAKSVRNLLDLAEFSDILHESYLDNLKATMIAELRKRQEAGYAKLKEMGVELDKVVVLPDEDSVPDSI